VGGLFEADAVFNFGAESASETPPTSEKHVFNKAKLLLARYRAVFSVKVPE
jgi:hypothetical protein